MHMISMVIWPYFCVQSCKNKAMPKTVDSSQFIVHWFIRSVVRSLSLRCTWSISVVVNKSAAHTATANNKCSDYIACPKINYTHSQLYAHHKMAKRPNQYAKLVVPPLEHQVKNKAKKKKRIIIKKTAAAAYTKNNNSNIPATKITACLQETWRITSEDSLSFHCVI